MMMTKKRKIKSTLSGEPKPQFVRWVVPVLGLVIAVGFAGTAEAQVSVINVPADYATIQDAVNASDPGDTIMVAEGEYAGAEIFTTVKIHGSGPSTRITTGLPPYGDGFDIVYGDAAGTEISNLAIELPADPDVRGVEIYKADNCTVRDVTITGTYRYGIFTYKSPDAVVTGNTILGTYRYGIYANSSPYAVVTGNKISGTYESNGIYANRSPYAVVTGNKISGTYESNGIYANRSPSADVTGNTISGTYRYGIYSSLSPDALVTGNTILGTYRYGIYANRSPSADVTGNTISGNGRVAIRVIRSSDVVVNGNQIVDFTGVSLNYVAIELRDSHNCAVVENTLERVKGPLAAGVLLRSGSSGNYLRKNNYKLSTLPGLPGLVCVKLTGVTNDNLVFESGGFPAGTNAKTQVVNGNPSGNRVVGHAANELAQQENDWPGIGQELQELEAFQDEADEEPVE